MTAGQLMVLVALVGSIVLVARGGTRPFALVALIASGIEALLVFRLIQLSVARFDLMTILAAAMLVAGGVCWYREGGKATVTSATAVALVGALQLAGRFL